MLPLQPAGAEGAPSAEITLPPVFIEKTVELGRNDTLSEAIIELGLPAGDVYAGLRNLDKKYSLRRLPHGQDVKVFYSTNAESGNPQDLLNISFYTKDDKIAKVQREENGTYSAEIAQRPLQIQQAVAHGRIDGSLYMAAREANLPTALVPAFANLFAWELDFTRDIRPGDVFRVIYEEVLDEEGQFIRNGEIIAAELTTRRGTHEAYRVEFDGKVAYYDSEGRSKERALLRTPLEFSRISSHFNLKRKHPILGYTRAHRGTDFAAPTGTPIKAAGDGVIEKAEWYGGFGRYIRIKHDKTYKTAYAHLHRYANGIRPGKRVRQGDIIGYVGSSGRSTGPHLHFELFINGKQVNAMQAKLPEGKQLAKKHMPQFKTIVAEYRSTLDNNIRLAQLEEGASQ